jgi:hypothetical protein
LEYAVSECDSAGNFYFNLNFDFSNTGSDGFNVTGNGNNYGNFSYENLPVQIGPFPSDDTPYEFHISDVSQPDCFATITPGVVNCTVATKPVDSDKFFQVFNNGTIPGIYARKNITLSLFNSSGKMIMDHIRISQDELFELNDQPSGLYIGTILYAGNRWPVKLVKAGY